MLRNPIFLWVFFFFLGGGGAGASGLPAPTPPLDPRMLGQSAQVSNFCAFHVVVYLSVIMHHNLIVVNGCESRMLESLP